MRRSRFSLSLFAAAALAAPLLASADPRYAVTAVAGANSWASDINIHGQVVGYLGMEPFSVPDELYPTMAFLYDSGEMIDLNTLIDPASGWIISGAAAINDLQQIAANACRAGVCQAVTLDLVPCVPEPPMIALLAAGLALGLARGKGGLRLPVRRRRG
jgi:probable HAF family extracellular repeat protein